MSSLLQIKELRTSFFTYAGEVKAVDGVSFNVDSGEAVAVVGESGCGKSATALSIMRLIPNPPGKIVGGSLLFDGEDLVKKTEREMQNIRGNHIGMIFQDPMTSLNPVLTVGLQIYEALELHQGMNRRDARAKAIEMLRLVGIPNPESRISQYPHQFSGGMRQRAMIAMALSCNPKLLIADEPTTALDVTIQAQIIELMKDLRDRLGTAIILITHDLGVVARLCTRVVVMYAGVIVEEGRVRDIYYRPKHPYTWGLLNSIPRLDAEHQGRLVPIHGAPPDLLAPPKGCPFFSRCSWALEVCDEHRPPMTHLEEGHRAACWLVDPRAPKVEAFVNGRAVS